MPKNSKGRPSICLLLTDLDYGGAELQAVNLAVNLRLRKWPVRLVTMIPPKALVGTLESHGIETRSLDMRRGIPDPRALFRLAGLLRSWRPQILHSHMVHANLLARASRVLARVPVMVSTAHSTCEGSRWRELAYRATDRLADLTTNVSRAAVERYVRVGAAPRGKIRFVPNGLDLDSFRPDPHGRHLRRQQIGVKETFVWLAVGRIVGEKDYPNMLRAFARVRLKREALLLIVGDGRLQEQTKALGRRLGIERSIRFLGNREDVPELMNAADAYVMSSAVEGMPMVLLEAAATGLPIVATDVGGNREVVVNGSNGFLVAPRNDAALGDAMQRMMDMSASERHGLGQAGRKHIQDNYSLSRVMDIWEDLYARLLERNGVEAST